MIPFLTGRGDEGGQNMHFLQNQQGFHCDAPADRRLISSVEKNKKSSVMQCSRE